jgi:hypothetical protein
LPTRVDAASPTPSGIMNDSAAMLSTIEWAATSAAPSRPASSAAPEKAHTSSEVWKPTGTPKRRISRMPRHANASRDHGTHAPACRSSATTHQTRIPKHAARVIEVAMPAPTSPSAGRPR